MNALFRRISGYPLRLIITLLLIGSAPVFSRAGSQGDREMITIPGGTFQMGDATGDPNEMPKTVSVAPFRIMKLEVTNRQFAQFVEASSYQTDAEISGQGYVWIKSWGNVRGADWRHPNGPKSSIRAIMDHPVVQVSARDAQAYCAWKKLRLPTEIEWEFAAKGLDNRKFPWGNSPPGSQAKRRANFGTLECCAPDRLDGYERTAPVGSYLSGASVYGVLDMAGNVWEWTSSLFPGAPDNSVIRGGGWGNNAYCLRTSYRHGNPPDIGLDMVGIRCAADAIVQ